MIACIILCILFFIEIFFFLSNGYGNEYIITSFIISLVFLFIAIHLGKKRKQLKNVNNNISNKNQDNNVINKLICPNCNSENINVQIVTNTKLETKHHSVLYWLFIGWWFHLLMWFFFTIPMLLIKMFGGKSQKIVQNNKKVAVCQSCGHSWNIK